MFVVGVTKYRGREKRGREVGKKYYIFILVKNQNNKFYHMELLKIFGLAAAELQKHLRLENIVFHNVVILEWNTCVISNVISNDPSFIEWHVHCTFETFISPSFLNKKCTSHFCRETTNKNYQFLI